MYLRGSRKSFADYFSPAEHAFTDYATSNMRSLLTGDMGGKRRGYRIGDNEADDEETDHTVVRYGGADGLTTTALAREWVGARFADDEPRDVLERTLRGGPKLLGGDEDYEDKPAAKPSAPDRRRREPAPEPPREVHPPLRPDEREAECKNLLSLIASLWYSRSSWVEDRKKARATLDLFREAWLATDRSIAKKKERLAALKYQLRIAELPFPMMPPRVARPGESGPASDIAAFGAVAQLKRDIAKVEGEIGELQYVKLRQEERIARAEADVKALDQKIRETDRLRIEPERQYRIKCGPLQEPPPAWDETPGRRR